MEQVRQKRAEKIKHDLELKKTALNNGLFVCLLFFVNDLIDMHRVKIFERRHVCEARNALF